MPDEGDSRLSVAGDLGKTKSALGQWGVVRESNPTAPLRSWLSEVAGLSGDDLSTAVAECKANRVKSTDALQKIYEMEMLSEIFTHGLIRAHIKYAFRQAPAPSITPDAPPHQTGNMPAGSLLQKLLHLLTFKIFPGNVQGFFPQCCLVFGYMAAVSIMAGVCYTNNYKVLKAYHEPSQIITFETLDTFPPFDLKICLMDVDVNQILARDNAWTESLQQRILEHHVTVTEVFLKRVAESTFAVNPLLLKLCEKVPQCRNEERWVEAKESEKGLLPLGNLTLAGDRRLASLLEEQSLLESMQDRRFDLGEDRFLHPNLKSPHIDLATSNAFIFPSVTTLMGAYENAVRRNYSNVQMDEMTKRIDFEKVR